MAAVIAMPGALGEGEFISLLKDVAPEERDRVMQEIMDAIAGAGGVAYERPCERLEIDVDNDAGWLRCA